MKNLFILIFGLVMSHQIIAQKCPVSGFIEAGRMNILYIGLGNDVQFAVSNTDSKTLRMTCNGCDSIVSVSDNNVKIWVSRPGQVVLNISSERLNFSKSFRVKYCPDPSIKLFNDQKGGNIKADIFKKQMGILPTLENFDFDMRCVVKSFTLTRIRDTERKSNINEGNIFNKNNLKLIESSQKGDIFTFTEIKGECTSDKDMRNWGSLVFFVE
jgi:GldM C-terminal domain